MSPNPDSVLCPPLVASLEGFPIPDKQITRFVKEQGLLELKGLALHVLTASTVASAMIRGIQTANATKPESERLQVNETSCIYTLIACHATRPTADAAKKGEATLALNYFLKEHDDLDLAYLLAVQASLPMPVLTTIYDINRQRGFPFQTIGPDNRYRPGSIDWNAAITQLASWSVAQGIISLEAGFADRIARHVGNATSPKQLTLEELLTYQQWGIQRLQDICNHFGTDNFLVWLRSKVQPNLDPETARKISDDLIKQLFNREPRPNEFLPTMEPYLYLAEHIGAINSQDKSNAHRRLLEHMLHDPTRAVNRLRAFGLLASE